MAVNICHSSTFGESTYFLNIINVHEEFIAYWKLLFGDIAYRPYLEFKIWIPEFI